LNWSEAIARLSAHGGAGMFAKQIMREQGAAGVANGSVSGSERVRGQSSLKAEKRKKASDQADFFVS